MIKLSSKIAFLLLLTFCLPAFGQSTGTIDGKVTTADGEAIPGVTVVASGDVLPRPRQVNSGADGGYRLTLLPPGNYELTYSLSGMASVTRKVKVLLQQTARVDVKMQPEGIEEVLEVTGELPVIDTSSAELKTAIDDTVIDQLPVGQQYQDLVKLIPGVQYTEDEIRGPSAGGSGQDNVYLFDGVNVGTPLFGTLAAEPSSHDIDQIAIVKGGAKAIDFNRSGGFTINSVSKSGTNAYHGAASYQVQSAGMTGDLDTGSSEEFDEDRDWAVLSIGGPVVKENLFFYTSYYRPTKSRDNVANAYGEVPDFDDERDELFGKLTFTPTDRFLLNASYRDSDRVVTGRGVSEFETASRSVGDDKALEIAIAEGSWVLSDKSYLTFKYTDYVDLGSVRPDTLFDFPITVGAGGTQLDVNNLDQQGELAVPTAATCGGDAACLAFIDPIINRYGYLEGGVPTGGGFVGGDDSIDQDDFFRENLQVGYDHLFGSGDVTHELHVGYQWYVEKEELARTSNGWGEIDVIGGVPSDGPAGSFFSARLQQAGTVGFPAGVISSEYESQTFEINDTIGWNDWTFNVGVVVSNDELFGQDLRENSSNLSGFEIDIGNKYKMYEIPWEDMIQPRLGAVWAYDEHGTVYANVARYNPAVSSLPRAASWARNSRNQVLEVFFDADGNQIFDQQFGGSSGKFFVPDMDPRAVEEYLVGTARQLNRKWTARAHARYRYANNFWEDTNNNGRSRLLAPDPIPQEDYIPNLNDYREEIGGSSYVIAELDGAANKYYEVNLEGEYRASKAYFRGTYVWSHYYGNFDQDNTSPENDANRFYGSSNISDFAGRQLWNDKYGNLRGDRRHQLKLYGYYNFDWNASVGVFAIYQSGQPWEAWNANYYRCLDPIAANRDENCRVGGTGSSSDTIRFGSCGPPDGSGRICPNPQAEPAGNRTTSDHYQIDLNYTQNFKLGDRYNIQLRADLFNVFDNQTGYNINPDEREAGFGTPRDFFNPQRLQLAVKFEF
ncbi:MAG: TonB-dependent receptor [bacterium]|nr:TonB-dependent receptor [bacterium]